MRCLPALLLLATLAHAQDADATTLYQRALWLEVNGDAAAAEPLYEEVWKNEAASERPRALLGVIRLRHARGAPIADLVGELERNFPDAAEEIAAARKLVAAQETAFDPRLDPDDTPADQAVKRLYSKLFGGELAKPESDMLADLGPRAHPMLRAVLRVPDYEPVARAAAALLMQRTPEADAIVAAALDDPDVVTKAAIVNALGLFDGYSLPLVESLARLYEKAPPRLRADVVYCLADAAASLAPEARAKAFDVLVRALGDGDAEVRARAYEAKHEKPADLPDAYVEALLDRMQKAPAEVPYGWFWKLHHFVHPRKSLRTDRIRRILAGYEPFVADQPPHEEGAVVLAQAALEWPADSVTTATLRSAATWSVRAATLLFETAIRRGDVNLVETAYGGFSRTIPTAEEVDRLKDRLVPLALDASDGRAQAAATAFLERFPLRADDYEAVVERARSGAGLHFAALHRGFLLAIGPDKAAGLVPLCAGAQQADALFRSGLPFSEREDRGLAFFAAIVPRITSGGSVHLLEALAKRDPRLAAIVGAHVLQARDFAAALGLLRREEVREAVWDDRLLAFTADPRQPVGAYALTYARDRRDVEALVRGLANPERSHREYAIRELCRLGGDPAAEALIAHFHAERTPQKERREIVVSMDGFGEKGVAFIRGLLGTPDAERDWDRIWREYFEVAPEAAVELALQAVRDKESDEYYRAHALITLTRTDDPRRLGVFREILRGQLEGDVETVLQTVGEQYLVELAAEVLPHLRSPDQGVREDAKRAVEALKFYAEAKDALGDVDR